MDGVISILPSAIVDVVVFRRVWDRIKPISWNATIKCSAYNPKIGPLTDLHTRWHILQREVAEKYQENIEILQNKFTNAKTNTKKNKVWDKNAVGVTSQRIYNAQQRKSSAASRRNKRRPAEDQSLPAPQRQHWKSLRCLVRHHPGLQSFETGAFRNGYHYY